MGFLTLHMRHGVKFAPMCLILRLQATQELDMELKIGVVVIVLPGESYRFKIAL